MFDDEKVTLLNEVKMKYLIITCAVVLILIISVLAQMATGLTPDSETGCGVPKKGI